MTSNPFINKANARETDQICDGFEAAWRSGDNPRVEEFLVDVTGTRRAAVLRELVLLDWSLRKENGEKPTVDQYCELFPEDRSLIRDVLESPETVECGSHIECPGTVIDNYKLLQQIGEGGFGIVFMAEQIHPVRRKVAFKVIKPGMDTKEVIARFEAERQALAMMDHPQIAKILDAGTSPAGRPYFVMDLVPGIEITKYCDENRVDLRKRLELFKQVCDAVQHAHQKGIIHRDIKPSNIIVTMHGDTPVPKIIDFGIAKATQTRLTERTLFTRFGQFIGTPTYMSPEQAEMTELAVDTRTDIYSLGVLLYELLTGKTPFDSRVLRTAGYEEIRRIIKEQEPVRPSTRVSTLRGNERTGVATARQCEPSKLGGLIRGELDWIVLKAMEKDRVRRYATANELMADVDRYLHNERVLAVAPSATYRLKKTISRNKGLLATATVVGVSLLLATFISLWQASVARAERNAALAILQDLREELKEKVFLAIMAGDEAMAEREIEKARDAGVPDETIALFRGQLSLYYGRPEEAITRLQKVSNASIAAQGMLATACFFAMDFDREDIALRELATRLHETKRDLTFEDQLFAGEAMINSDMIAGMKLVEQALDEHRGSPLAQVIHAKTLSAFAHNTGDIDKMELALQQINKAMRWVGETPTLRYTHNMVQHIALTFDMREEARIDLDQVRSEWPLAADLAVGRMGVIRLLADLDDPQLAQRIAACPQITDGEMAFYGPILLQYWPPDEVLAFIEKRPRLDTHGELVRARLMALLPDKRDDALELCTKLMQTCSKYYIRNSCLHTLLMLGEGKKVQTLARDFAESSDTSHWYHAEIMQFLAEGGSDQDFLDGADEVRAWQVGAFYSLAMRRFAEKDHLAAQDMLRKCIATGAHHSLDYWWAKAFLKSMNGDLPWKLEIE